LSKGMGRRLAWAQATIHKPALVVLDEPFSGLDPLGRRYMKGWIDDLKASGASIILCTHELDHLDTLCDDFYILQMGRLVFSSGDKKTGDETTSTEGKSFSLSVSGLSEADATKLKNAEKLPAWSEFKRSGFLSTLHFTSHQDGALWLSACVSEHF